MPCCNPARPAVPGQRLPENSPGRRRGCGSSPWRPWGWGNLRPGPGSAARSRCASSCAAHPAVVHCLCIVEFQVVRVHPLNRKLRGNRGFPAGFRPRFPWRSWWLRRFPSARLHPRQKHHAVFGVHRKFLARVARRRPLRIGDLGGGHDRRERTRSQSARSSKWEARSAITPPPRRPSASISAASAGLALPPCR